MKPSPITITILILAAPFAILIGAVAVIITVIREIAVAAIDP
jgi:hypothetical protein